MSSTHRPLTGLYRSFLNGQPLVNALIKIRLSKNDYDLEAGYPVEEKEIRTTDTGQLPDDTTIWKTSRGLDGSKVVFTEPDNFKWEAPVPEGDAPISVQELRANGIVITSPDTVLSLIANTDLEDLRDVEFTALQDGQAVVWDETAGKFVNRLVSGGPGGVAGVSSVNDRAGAVTLSKGDVGLNNVNNTADANKPVSNSTQAALNAKQDSLGFTPVRSAVGSPRTTTAIWCGTTAQLALINPRDLNTLYVEI